MKYYSNLYIPLSIYRSSIALIYINTTQLKDICYISYSDITTLKKAAC